MIDTETLKALLVALECSSPRTGFMGIPATRDPIDVFCDRMPGLARELGYVKVEHTDNGPGREWEQPSVRWMRRSSYERMLRAGAYTAGTSRIVE